jgi:Xaa-Pro aminopeptidase
MASDARTVSRRRLLQLSGCAGALLVGGHLDAEAPAPPAEDLPAPIRALRPMTDGVSPITPDEHRARLARAQKLLAENGLDAMVVGPGSSLAYFTGTEWGLSERFLGMVLGGTGDPVWVAPAFERDRALEQIRLGTDVRVWQEDESPYALVARALRDRGRAAGRVAIEETMPFAFSDGIAQALPAARLASATPVTAGCRTSKDPHELALIRRACAITLAAYRAVFASLAEGQTVEQVSGWVAAAHRRLGVRGGALVLFGSDAAFPHGTRRPRALVAGDVVLVDGGGRVHGYQSDVTRTAVFGARPTDRQRRIWDLVRKAQEAAFEATRPGVECQAVDAAARKVVEDGGFGPGYTYFTHRLGHGIGLDGHEWPYVVRGNRTKLTAGTTFTDEPGVYVPGELGIRLEDTVVVTESGCENLAPRWPGTPEDPAVV